MFLYLQILEWKLISKNVKSSKVFLAKKTQHFLRTKGQIGISNSTFLVGFLLRSNHPFSEIHFDLFLSISQLPSIIPLSDYATEHTRFKQISSFLLLFLFYYFFLFHAWVDCWVSNWRTRCPLTHQIQNILKENRKTREQNKREQNKREHGSWTKSEGSRKARDCKLLRSASVVQPKNRNVCIMNVCGPRKVFFVSFDSRLNVNVLHPVCIFLLQQNRSEERPACTVCSMNPPSVLMNVNCWIV